MSFSCEAFKDQYKEISVVAEDFFGEVVLETNKRVVVRFNKDHDARSFAYNLRHNDYQCCIKPGIKSDSMYVQVGLNAPY